MNLVSYCRVSTDKQGRSGLGLEAQKAAIDAYAVGHTVLATYIEVESGKVNSRPELAKALAHCKRARARLVIAKLDRLARNVAFIANLMEAQADFVACDNPYANKAMLQMMAVFAEMEADAISTRTKAALQAAKARGVKLGSASPNWKGTAESRLRGCVNGRLRIREITLARYGTSIGIAADLRNAGATYAAIAAHFNSKGITSNEGSIWTPALARRVCMLAEKPLPVQ